MVTASQMADAIATQMTQLAGRIDAVMPDIGTRLSGLEESTTAVVANIKRESGTFAAKLEPAQADIASAIATSSTQASAQIEDLNTRAINVSDAGATLKARTAEGLAKLEKFAADAGKERDICGRGGGA